MIGVLVSGEGTNLQALLDAGLPVRAVASNRPGAYGPNVSARATTSCSHLLTPVFLDRYPGRIVNVHPSLLPEFPGARAIHDALAAGVATTGVTVHLVDEGLDTGDVIRQEPLPVEPRETLTERIQAIEHRLLPEVVRELCVH